MGLCCSGMTDTEHNGSFERTLYFFQLTTKCELVYSFIHTEYDSFIHTAYFINFLTVVLLFPPTSQLTCFPI